MYQKLWDIAHVVLREKFVPILPTSKEKNPDRSQRNNTAPE
jgi:hypothetical protein